MTDTYSNQDLRDECDMARQVLTTRRLNTELSNIKMRLLAANNALNKSITYTYIYDPANNINDYFELFLYKLQCMFYESSIEYSTNSSSLTKVYSKPIIRPTHSPTYSSSLIPISYTIIISWT
jgi:hypothetical protein